MMTRLAISGYRSLRDVRVTLGALNVVTGANGSGKSSLYRALKLLADIAQGPGEGTWRNRRQERHATPMDVAFAVTDRQILNAS